MSFVKNDQELGFAPEVWEYGVDSGLVVVRAGTPSLFCLNATAALIWQAYSTSGSKERAAAALIRAFGIPPETAVSDVLSTVSDWTATGLLGKLGSASSPAWNGMQGAATVIAHCSIEGTVFVVVTDCQEVIADVAPRLEPIAVEPCTPDVTLAVWRSADDPLQSS